MPALPESHESSGGDGGDLRAPEGMHRAVLAEAIYLGKPENQWGKAYPKALIIFELPEQLVPDTVPDELAHMRGTPVQVYWWVNNFSFSNSDDAGFRTAYETSIATWFGKGVPKGVQPKFLMGREYGDGADQLKAGLTGAEAQQQRKDKPGVPVGTACLLRIVHVKQKKSGKTYAQPAPALPPAAPTDPDLMKAWQEEVANWKPGLSPDPDAKTKPLTVSEGYVPYEKRERKGDKSDNGDGGKTKVESGLDEPEDDGCPF